MKEKIKGLRHIFALPRKFNANPEGPVPRKVMDLTHKIRTESKEKKVEFGALLKHITMVF